MTSRQNSWAVNWCLHWCLNWSPHGVLLFAQNSQYSKKYSTQYQWCNSSQNVNTNTEKTSTNTLQYTNLVPYVIIYQPRTQGLISAPCHERGGRGGVGGDKTLGTKLIYYQINTYDKKSSTQDCSFNFYIKIHWN